MGEKRKSYRLFVEKPERKRRRWIYNIKMDLSEMGLGGVDWIGLALVNAVMNLRIPYNVGKLPSGCMTCGLSSGAQLHRVS
jgi:hypothetical protein